MKKELVIKLNSAVAGLGADCHNRGWKECAQLIRDVHFWILLYTIRFLNEKTDDVDFVLLTEKEILSIFKPLHTILKAKLDEK